jgi:hypothetical protein
VVGEHIVSANSEALEWGMFGSSWGDGGVALAWPACTPQFSSNEKDGEGKSDARAPKLMSAEQPCKACMAGKQRMCSFPAQVRYRAEAVLEVLHDDLCDKITSISYSWSMTKVILCQFACCKPKIEL